MGMDVYGIENETAYFRASVWSWKPIHMLIREANERFRLGIPAPVLDAMAGNDGDGLGNQSECNALADGLEKLLSESPTPVFTLDIDPTGPEGAVEALLRLCGWDVKSGPCYRAERVHVEEFIGFLRTCGGFRVF